MKKRVNAKQLAALAGLLLGFHQFAIAQDAPRVILSSPSDATLAERGVITYTLSNPTDERIAVVAFETPFAIGDDRLGNVQFEVANAKGEALSYQGRNVNFGPPEASSFVILEPHQSIHKNVDIAKDYGITQGGAYKVTYTKTLRLLRSSSVQRIKSITPSDEMPLEPVRSNTLTVWINKALMDGQTATAIASRDAVLAAAATCTDAQSSTLTSDLQSAASVTFAALNHLQSGYTYDKDENGNRIHAHQTDPRYTWWFGTYDSSIFLTDPDSINSDNAHVDQVLGATAYRLSSGKMTFECGCDARYPESTRAWAETHSTYHVHICDSYFKDPINAASPLPSRIANLAHEGTHFLDQYATDTGDTYYTTPEAHAAAQSAQSTAVRTAVNYEFYIMDATRK